MLPFLANAYKHIHKKAIYVDNNSYSYEELMNASCELSLSLLDNSTDLKEQRIAFMVTPGFDYVTTLWGIWSAGGIAVPLCITHPLPALEYVLEDSSASVLILSKSYLDIHQSNN